MRSKGERWAMTSRNISFGSIVISISELFVLFGGMKSD
jgi:hypothetical protein